MTPTLFILNLMMGENQPEMAEMMELDPVLIRNKGKGKLTENQNNPNLPFVEKYRPAQVKFQFQFHS